MQAAVGHPEVLLGVAQVELVHCGHEARGLRWLVEHDGELLGDPCVLEAGSGNHVQRTLPHLV